MQDGAICQIVNWTLNYCPTEVFLGHYKGLISTSSSIIGTLACYI